MKIYVVLLVLTERILVYEKAENYHDSVTQGNKTRIQDYLLSTYNIGMI